MDRPGTGRLARFVDAVSFNGDVRNLVEILNREMEAPERLQGRLKSHPAGFVKEVSKRRLTIAEAYLRLITATGVDHWQTRLDCIETMVHQAWHSKTLSMPINTARVQTALMKECVKARGDKRRQLELMSDFALASHGRQNVVRRLLRELDLIEVPEDGRPLKEMDLGWDDHVHDFLTEGRKTPSQLLLDAFIQGISRLTVVYYDLTDPRVFEEALEAGRLLGIRVEVGIEFSVGPRHRRQHFMFLPPDGSDAARLRAFQEEHRSVLAPFHAGLAANAEKRRRTISALLESFNETRVRELNARFKNLPFLQVQPARWEDLEAVMQGGQASRIHMGQLLADRIKPVLHKRVLYLKNQFRDAQDKLRRGEASSWEVEALRSHYLETRAEYEGCSVASLRERFMPSREGVDYDSAFPTHQDVLSLLASTGGRIVFIHPMSQGAEAAVSALLYGHRWIHEIETFNLADSQGRDPSDLRRLNHLVAALNRGAVDEVVRLLDDWGVPAQDRAQVEAACAWYREHPLVPRCGSDYVGRDSKVPGMGFVRTTALERHSAQALSRAQHLTLAAPIGRLLLQRGDEAIPVEAGAGVVVLAPPPQPWKNLVGDEPERSPLNPLRLWRYLNPSVKSLFKVAFAFLPAYVVTVQLVDPAWTLAYTFLWLAITGARNMVVDLIAASGFAFRTWKIESVDRDNLANSLFWTGFSVPILGAVKGGFDGLWPMISADEGLLRNLVKFWVIAFANGLYISTHNKIRGFDQNVIRANFFRTVLSWPLATMGSYGLDLLSIPTIVQSKLWSDAVAAVIEGTGKVASRLRLCERDLIELLRALAAPGREARLTAMADILYVWARRYQGRAALRRILAGRVHANLRLPEGGALPGPDELRRAYDRLMEGIGTDGSMETLTELILSHYSGREAVVLTDLVAQNHSDFVRWLGRNAPSGDGRPAGERGGRAL